MRAGQGGPVKIGWSSMCSERLKVCQSWSPIKLTLEARTPGGERLECRFHVHFAHLHMHGEWFRAAPELDAAIDAINAGTFDLDTLPEGRRIPRATVYPREAVEAQRYSRLLSALYHVVEIPKDVSDASHTYGLDADEKSACRAIVREFVDAHAHLLDDAKRAQREHRQMISARRQAA
jgi:hypothetical protein